MCLLLRGTLDFAYPRRKVYLLRDQLVSERGQQLSYPTHAKFVICDWTIENRLHYRRDVTLGEDASQVRRKGAPEVVAALNGGLLALMDWLGVTNVAKQMRHFCAQPQEALQLLMSKLSR